MFLALSAKLSHVAGVPEPHPALASQEEQTATKSKGKRAPVLWSLSPPPPTFGFVKDKDVLCLTYTDLFLEGNTKLFNLKVMFAFKDCIDRHFLPVVL